MIPDNLNSNQIEEILKDLVLNGGNTLAPILEKLLNLLALAEREKYLNAEPYERCETRLGYANGFKDKTYQTRSGPLHLQVPQVRDGGFYPSCFEKGTKSERALKLAIAEMYVQGVSTRRVKEITKELCGLEISSTQVSRAAALLDKELEEFRLRPLGRIKFLYLDAHYENVRHGGTVIDLAVLKAIGVNFEGHREVLGVSVSLSEAEVHWRDFLKQLISRGLSGMELIISDDHAGLKSARKAVFPATPWQRCVFHLAQNAQSYVPKKSMREEIAQSVRDIYNSPTREAALAVKESAVKNYSSSAPAFCHWLENNIEEGLTFMNFPRSCWKKIRTSNVVERVNGEVKRRTRVARLFPNEGSCLRLVTAVLQEIHEGWKSGKKYMTLED